MISDFKTVSVIGLGYIGLPAAAMLAKHGMRVIGVDTDPVVVKTINNGQVHIIEPELDTIVNTAVKQGYLRATTNTESADAFLIAVPTPFKGEHEFDDSYVRVAARSIAKVLKEGDLVILESTCPVGATEQIAELLAQEREDLRFPQHLANAPDINIAYCPERVLPGKIVKELVTNPRIIGGMTAACSQRATRLYEIFVRSDCIETDVRTAEMCKLTENAFRDVNIAFANELSIICDKLDVDVSELIELSNRHPRVKILKPGPGVGGHCIAVDPWFIVSKNPTEAKLIRTAREVNDTKPSWVISKIETAVTEYLQKNPSKAVQDVTIACLGLAYKPNTKDLRESPALKITKELAETHPGAILVVEPNIDSLPSDLVELNVQLTTADKADALADIKVILVDHVEFQNIGHTASGIIDLCCGHSSCSQ